MRWRRSKQPTPGRLASLGQDYTEGHRRYVERLGPTAELWLRTKPFSAPPTYELQECLRTFSHVVDALGLGLRAKILDVGCGPGWLSEFLARSGYDVTGIDVSEDMVEIARERIAALGPVGEDLEARGEFHAMPVLELPWRERFDGAVLYDAMHHFHDEVATLEVIRRALVPGGRIFIHEGIRPEPGSAGEHFLIAEMEHYGTLESPFDPDYLRDVLAQAGFEDVRRFAAVDELLDVSQEAAEVERIQTRLRYPPMNTFLAVNPVQVEATGDPGAFRGRIESSGSWEPTQDGQALSLGVTVTNSGEALWPAAIAGRIVPGTVSIAPYLEGEDGARAELERVVLPRAIAPGEWLGAEVRIPSTSVEGRREVVIDLVREGIAWFGDLASTPLRVPLP
jgi:SAM-dependent methyltransferase